MKPRDSFVRVSCECVRPYCDPIFAILVPFSSQKGGDSRLGRLRYDEAATFAFLVYFRLSLAYRATQRLR